MKTTTPSFRFSVAPISISGWERVRVNFTALEIKIDKRKLQHGTISVQVGQWANPPGNIARIGLLPNFGLNFSDELFHANRGLSGLSTPDL
jgi:hypothetical protein